MLRILYNNHLDNVQKHELCDMIISYDQADQANIYLIPGPFEDLPMHL